MVLAVVSRDSGSNPPDATRILVTSDLINQKSPDTAKAGRGRPCIRPVLCAWGATARGSSSRLMAEGWTLVSVRGSHHKFRKGDRTVIVPHPKKDLPPGTVRAMSRQIGWKETNE